MKDMYWMVVNPDGEYLTTTFRRTRACSIGAFFDLKAEPDDRCKRFKLRCLGESRKAEKDDPEPILLC